MAGSRGLAACLVCDPPASARRWPGPAFDRSNADRISVMLRGPIVELTYNKRQEFVNGLPGRCPIGRQDAGVPLRGALPVPICRVRCSVARIFGRRPGYWGAVTGHRQLSADPALVPDNDGMADRGWRGWNPVHSIDVVSGHARLLLQPPRIECPTRTHCPAAVLKGPQERCQFPGRCFCGSSVARNATS